MKTYTVRCEWDPTGWWVVTIPDVPGAITQSRRLDQVESDVAEVLELMTGESPDDYELTLDWHVPGQAGTTAAEANRLRAEAEDMQDRLFIATRSAVHELRDAGFSYRDIGTMTGMSYQRAQQIARKPVDYDNLRFDNTERQAS